MWSKAGTCSRSRSVWEWQGCADSPGTSPGTAWAAPAQYSPAAGMGNGSKGWSWESIYLFPSCFHPLSLEDRGIGKHNWNCDSALGRWGSQSASA